MSKCCVCQEGFSSSTDPNQPRTPMVSSCGHSCCRDCLMKWIATKVADTNRKRKNFPCPFCGQKDKFHSDKLVVNLGLCQALAMIPVITIPDPKEEDDEEEEEDKKLPPQQQVPPPPPPPPPQASVAIKREPTEDDDDSNDNDNDNPEQQDAAETGGIHRKQGKGESTTGQADSTGDNGADHVGGVMEETDKESTTTTTTTTATTSTSETQRPALQQRYRLRSSSVPNRTISYSEKYSSDNSESPDNNNGDDDDDDDDDDNDSYENEAYVNIATRPHQRKRRKVNTLRHAHLSDDGSSSEDESSVQGHTMTASTSVSSSVNNTMAAEIHNNTSSGMEIKSEYKHFHRKQAQTTRRFGNRSLLARQSANGMMKLGGGNCATRLYPGPKNINHPRFQAPGIGVDKAVACDDLWNPHGPKWAGMETACVPTWPSNLEKDEAFGVFMKRTGNSTTEFGWEYCGHYKLIDPEMETFSSAHKVSDASKKKKIGDIVNSVRRMNGYWVDVVEKWRETLVAALSADDSPPGPQWMVEGRKPTTEETELKRDDNDKPIVYSLAARARALGFTTGMSNEDLAKILVEFDEFHTGLNICFVEYKEAMYNFVKDGETTRNAQGKPRQKNGNGTFLDTCAKASDWYNFLDQHML